MNFLEGLQFSMVLVAGLLLSYRVALTILALFYKELEDFGTAKNRKFAIVLLAKSDESIARSLYSLSGMVYPKNLYELIVVTDNKANKSIETAEKLGATMLIMDQNHAGETKLDLPWVFDQFLQWDTHQKYDAVITFDTDNLVAGNYLEVMNYYLEEGCSVIQGGYRALPKQENGEGEIVRMKFLIHNYVFSFGTKLLGLKTSLRSNGSCFATTVLRKYAWQNLYKKSDAELGFMMQQDKIKIELAPEAIIFVDASIRDHSHILDTKKYQGNRNLTSQVTSIPNMINRIPDMLINYPTVIQLMVFITFMVVLNFLGWIFEITPLLFLGIWAGIMAVGMCQFYFGLKVAGIEDRFSQGFIDMPVYLFNKVTKLLKSIWEKRGQTLTKKSEDDNQDTVNDKEQIVQ